MTTPLPEEKKKIILDLCGGTGSWSRPYKEAGYDVRVVTLPDNDVRTYKPPKNVYGILAAPPCDEFSIAKNRDIKRNFKKGMEIVDACLKIIMTVKPKWWALENPDGYLKDFIGKTSYTFQPWEYGDPWTKKTRIWGTAKQPKKKYTKWEDLPKLDLYIRPRRKKPAMASLHKSSQEKIPQLRKYSVNTDAAFRSITPPGFANAFFKANQ